MRFSAFDNSLVATAPPSTQFVSASAVPIEANPLPAKAVEDAEAVERDRRAAEAAAVEAVKRKEAAEEAEAQALRRKAEAEAAEAESVQRMQAAKATEAESARQQQAAEAALEAQALRRKAEAEAAEAESVQRMQAAKATKPNPVRQQQAAEAALEAQARSKALSRGTFQDDVIEANRETQRVSAARTIFSSSTDADSTRSTTDGNWIWVFLAAFCLIYVAPTIVAFRRRHPNRWVIAALNLVGGVTGFLWVITLIWAFRAVHISPTRNNGGESGLNIVANDEVHAVISRASPHSSRSLSCYLMQEISRCRNTKSSKAVFFDRLR